MPRIHPFALALLLCAPVATQADDDPGHSSHGTAFDSGLRQRPWKMEGIGHTHFPITTKAPEVQEWFDQGNTLLHSFWFEEAERSFRGASSWTRIVRWLIGDWHEPVLTGSPAALSTLLN